MLCVQWWPLGRLWNTSFFFFFFGGGYVLDLLTLMLHHLWSFKYTWNGNTFVSSMAALLTCNLGHLKMSDLPSKQLRKSVRRCVCKPTWLSYSANASTYASIYELHYCYVCFKVALSISHFLPNCPQSAGCWSRRWRPAAPLGSWLCSTWRPARRRWWRRKIARFGSLTVTGWISVVEPLGKRFFGDVSGSRLFDTCGFLGVLVFCFGSWLKKCGVCFQGIPRVFAQTVNCKEIENNAL